ncbi:MAG: DUF481 domain-containing protein, partial [Planctomycetota bacterium]|nr:DUF481 domain-containing protein [Planctomycetota bacterium]
VEGGVLKIRPAFGGEVAVEWKRVRRVDTDKPLPIELKDGRKFSGTLRPEGEADGRARIVGEDGKDIETISLDAVAAVNPKVEPLVKWEGSVTASGALSRGNVNSITAIFRAGAVRRTRDDRLTLAAGYDYGETERVKTREQGFVSAKYDYFVTKKLFVYGNAKADRDEFADLDARISAGAGLGIQWVETKRTRFSSEAGVSYVYEWHNEDDDDGYAAGRAASAFSVWILPDRLQYRLEVEGLLNMEDKKDWIANGRTGFRWMLTKNWLMELGAQATFDHKPAEGRKREDVIYTLGFGYSF